MCVQVWKGENRAIDSRSKAGNAWRRIRGIYPVKKKIVVLQIGKRIVTQERTAHSQKVQERNNENTVSVSDGGDVGGGNGICFKQSRFCGARRSRWRSRRSQQASWRAPWTPRKASWLASQRALGLRAQLYHGRRRMLHGEAVSHQ